jgi:hypothetical protein
VARLAALIISHLKYRIERSWNIVIFIIYSSLSRLC